MERISVIIPVYNEAESIANTVAYLRKIDLENYLQEIIVVDGGSTDGSVIKAKQTGALVVHSAKGRARQMNKGAAIAKGEVLYFLHADTLPPNGFTKAIKHALDEGFAAGCFRLRFDTDHWFLNANAWFTRFNENAFRFGDQSLFVCKSVFESAGGFNEQNIILEDQEIINRLQQFGRFKVMDPAVVTSSRKYLKNGIYKTQFVYFLVYILYRLKVPQEKLLRLYRRLIQQDKL